MPKLWWMKKAKATAIKAIKKGQLIFVDDIKDFQPMDLNLNHILDAMRYAQSINQQKQNQGPFTAFSVSTSLPFNSGHQSGRAYAHAQNYQMNPINLSHQLNFEEAQAIYELVIQIHALELDRMQLKNNCKVTGNKIKYDSINGVSLIVTWTCLNCNTTYTEDIGSDKNSIDKIKCLDNCSSPLSSKKWKYYLSGNSSRNDLKARKQYVRTFVNSISDSNLIDYLEKLLTQEKMTLGEKRMYIILLTEDKKRSRRNICQR
jgi:hypothetical protein